MTSLNSEINGDNGLCLLITGVAVKFISRRLFIWFRNQENRTEG